jgi:ligand-binding SRPBCC domain-containing protein
MRIHELRREQVLDGTPEELFAFFADAVNLEALTPPLLRFRVLTPAPIEMRVGTFIQYRLRLHGVPVGWKTLIQAWEPPHRFVDVQVSGPYALWHHTHELSPVSRSHPTQTLMRDTVRYAIGFGPLGAIAHRLLVRRDVEAIFAFRAQEIPRLLRASRAGVDRPDDSGRR